MEKPVENSMLRDALAHRYKWQRIRIFLVTWIAYGGFYLTRKGFSVAKVELVKPEVMGWDKADLAWIDGGYLTAYAVGQFLWGMCGDRFGTRKVILTGMLASIVVSAAMAGSSSIWGMGVLFCLQGLCQATGWAPLAKNIGQFFSQRERGRVMGIWCTNYALGGFIASVLAACAAGWWGWPYAFSVPAAVLMVIWILFFFFQYNKPEDAGLPSIEQYHGIEEAVLATDEPPEEEQDGSWQVILEVLRTPMVWLLAAVYFLLKPTRYMILFCSPLYISERLGSSTLESGILGSMFDLAGPLGVLAGGFLSDLVFKSKRMPMSIVSLFLLSVLMFFFNDLPATEWTVGIGFFVIGFLLYIPDSLVSGTAAIDFGTKKGASTAAGLINGCGSIGAIAGGTMPGWIEGLTGKEGFDWNYVFWGLSACLLAGAFLLLPQWNTLPKTGCEKKA